MISVLLVLCLLTFCLLLATGWKLRSVFEIFGSKPEPGHVATERSERFYAPMRRLLNEADFNYLTERPGATPKMISRMRADRRRIFRSYLSSLSMDFRSLASQIRNLMVNSPESRDDLAAALLRAQVIFSATLIAIEYRLMLHAFGFTRLNLSAAKLTESLAQMKQNLAQLTPVTA